MAGPNYIHVRDSDDIVVAVYGSSVAEPAGVTEYYETHPIFQPLWSQVEWERTGANTYVNTGNDVDPEPDTDAIVSVSADDTTSDFLDTKITAGNAVTLTINTDSLGAETLDIAVDQGALDDDYVNEIGDTMTGDLNMSGAGVGIKTDTSDDDNPTYTFTGHTDTGMYLEPSGDLAFTVNGICTLEISDTDNVVFISNQLPTYEDLVTFDNAIPNKKYVDDAISANGGVYGSEMHYQASEGQSSTTSGTLQTKTSMTTASLPSGTYKLTYSYEISNGSNGVLSEVNVILDGTTVNITTFEADSDYHSMSGIVHQSLNGVITATIKFKAQGGTAKIRRARLELIRVS